MRTYPDTSFLCGLYRQQENSRQAAACFRALDEALHVTGLLLYEFRQSLRLQVWLHRQDPRKGCEESACAQALEDLRSDLGNGTLVVVPADWADVHRIAERLSETHTPAAGHRALDILHVATALHLGAEEFLTFDSRQRRLAAGEGLRIKP